MSPIERAWDGPLFGHIAIVWFLFLVAWAIARGGMRALSRYEPRAAPGGVATADSRPTFGSLGGLRLIAGAVLLAASGVALVDDLRTILDRADPVTALVILVPVLAAVTFLEWRGRALLLRRLSGRSQRPPAISLGAGNSLLFGLVLGIGGWLLLRTQELRMATARFLRQVPDDIGRISLDGPNVDFGWAALVAMALGHVLMIAARRRRHAPGPVLPPAAWQAAPPRPRTDTEARLAEAWQSHRRSRGRPAANVVGHMHDVGRSDGIGAEGREPIDHGAASETSDGRGLIGMLMAMGAIPFLFIGFAPQAVADWQLVALGLFAALSFVAAVRWSM